MTDIKDVKAGPDVALSNTASVMLSSLFPKSAAQKAAIREISSDVHDPSKIKRVAGYDDVYVARGHGLRVVFKREGDSLTITSVAAET